MVTLVNRAKMSTSTTGTGTITLGTAESGYQSFADAGVTNGDVVRYVIEDGDDWEIGSGTYTATGTTLTRTVDESSNSDAALNLTGSAVVFITAAAEDVFQGELIAESPSSPTAPTVTGGTNSVAIGSGSVSDGTNSIAIGTNADSNSGVAIGYNAQVTSLYATAIGADMSGNGAIGAGFGSVALGASRAGGTDSFAAAIASNSASYGATGSNSIAIGQQAKGTNTGSLGFGVSTTASGQYALAMGYQSTAAGTQSVAIGRANQTSGNFALSLGYNSTASASNSVAIGDTNTASHANAITIGDSVQSTAINQVSIGGTADTVRISESYTLPTTDGTNGQVLTTDGSGAVTFADAGGGAALELYAENPSSPTAPSATGTNAVAIGSASLASNSNAIAAGFSSAAQGADSVAIGRGATSSNFSGATALGLSASAYGTQAIALGKSRASGTDSFAAAIANNTSSYGATGANSVAMGDRAKATVTNAIAIGDSARATGSQSPIAIGVSTDATAAYAAAFGHNAHAQGEWCLALGGKTSAIGSRSIAIGQNANAALIQGAIKISNSPFGSRYQNGVWILSSDTTDATPKAITTNTFAASSNNQIILPNNSAYAFHGTIVARQKAGDGTASAAWKVEGLIRREGSAGTTVLVNSATTVLDNTPGWGMALSADTTNGGLKVEATGAASTNIRWVATIHTSEVTYA